MIYEAIISELKKLLGNTFDIQITSSGGYIVTHDHSSLLPTSVAKRDYRPLLIASIKFSDNLITANSHIFDSHTFDIADPSFDPQHIADIILRRYQTL